MLGITSNRKLSWENVLNAHMPYFISYSYYVFYVRLKLHLFCFLSIVYDPICNFMSEVEEITLAIIMLAFENKKSYVQVTRKKKICGKRTLFLLKFPY